MAKISADHVDEYRRMVDAGDWKAAAIKFRGLLGDHGLEALKAAAAEPRPKRMICGNCGEEFTMPAHAIAGRASAGWCPGCWNQREQCQRNENGKEYWTTGRAGKTPFDSRPKYN